MILTRKSKALLALTLVFCLAVCLVPVTAQAAEGIDTDRGGVITLDMPDTYRGKLIEANAATGVKVYQISTVSATGAYSPLEAYATEEITGELANLNLNSNLSALTAAVTAIIDEANANVPEGGEPAIKPTISGTYALVPGVVDAEGNPVSNQIRIPDGQLGLYLLVFDDLLVGTEYFKFSSLLLSVPSLGTDDEAANGRQPAPTPEPGAETTPEPTVHLDWQYDFTVFMKPTVTPATGKVRIVKNLTSFNATAGTASFVFRVTVVDEQGNVVRKPNGAPLYSDVVSLKMNAAGEGEIILDDLPYGYYLQVEEIDAGGYTYVGIDPATGRVAISLGDDNVLTVTVTNNGFSTIPGNSVVNHYEHIEVEQQDGSKRNSWDYEQQPDSSAKGGLEE